MPKTRLIVDRGEMLRELQTMRPTKIAVAYVGQDWEALLGPKRQLKELIVAPIAGTSPRAVEQIADEIGWENVHFLDTLHAKVYLGSRSAMFGSANLSSRALAAGGVELYELATATTDLTLRAKLDQEFVRYRKLAIDAYGADPDISEARKRERLGKLRDAQPQIDVAKVKLAAPKQACSLADFQIGSRAIHLEWWEAYTAAGEPDDTDYMDLYIQRRHREVQVGNWVLDWRCTPSGKVGKKFDLDWLRIDVIRKGRNKGSAFVDQVAERHKPPPYQVPFRLDPRVKKLFQVLIMERDDLRPTDLSQPMPTPSLALVDGFIRELKKRYIAASIDAGARSSLGRK